MKTKRTALGASMITFVLSVVGCSSASPSDDLATNEAELSGEGSLRIVLEDAKLYDAHGKDPTAVTAFLFFAHDHPVVGTATRGEEVDVLRQVQPSWAIHPLFLVHVASTNTKAWARGELLSEAALRGAVVRNSFLYDRSPEGFDSNHTYFNGTKVQQLKSGDIVDVLGEVQSAWATFAVVRAAVDGQPATIGWTQKTQLSY